MIDVKVQGSWKTAVILLICSSALCAIAGWSFADMWRNEEVIPAEGFKMKMLSDYFDGIKGTPADSPVYIQEGKEPGGSIFVLGGTHPNEPSGTMTAVLLLERAKVTKGRLIIIPFANIMGRDNNYPQEGDPQYVHFNLPDGSKRAFRYGSRLTNPLYEWPCPDIYIHPSSGQELAGKEMGNLNRCYPGLPDGPITQKLAYAIVQLIKAEKPDLSFDLHEASPEYPVVNAIVAHERAMELAAMTTMELEGRGIQMRLEPSPTNLRGLSHREWGDFTDTMAILMETANPCQGRLRGKTDETLALTGVDKYYVRAMELGRLYIPYDGKQDIAYRVARHTTSIMVFMDMLGMMDESKGVSVEGIPGFEEIIEKGVGAFLSPSVSH